MGQERQPIVARLLQAGYLLFPSALAALLFVPSLGDWFMMHDFIHIRGATWTPASRYVQAIFDPSDGGDSIFNTGNLYRPFYYLAMLAEARLFGLDPLPYHLVNVGLHVLNVALVWWLAYRLLGRRYLAGLAALGYVLHPLAVDAVTWISAITELLVATFTLGAVALWLESYRGEGMRSVLLWTGAVGLATAAMLSREPGVAAPLVLVAYHIFHEGRSVWRRPSALLPVLLPAAVLGGYVALRLPTLLEAAAGDSVGLGRVGWHIPQNLFLYLGWAVVPVWSGEPAWVVLRGVGAILVLRVFEAVLRRGEGPGRFLLLWWLLFALPYSTAEPVIQAGRYNYILLAPLAILGAQLLSDVAIWLAPRLPRPAMAPRWALLVGALCALAVPAGFLHVYHQRTLHGMADSSHDLMVALAAQYPSLPAGATLYVDNSPPALLFGGGPFYLDPMVDLMYGVDVRVVLGQPPPGASGVYSFVYRPQ